MNIQSIQSIKSLSGKEFNNLHKNEIHYIFSENQFPSYNGLNFRSINPKSKTYVHYLTDKIQVITIPDEATVTIHSDQQSTLITNDKTYTKQEFYQFIFDHFSNLNTFDILCIDKEFQTQEMVNQHIKMNKYSLIDVSNINEKFLTQDMCNKHFASKFNRDVIPIKFINQELYDYYIEQNPECIEYVPREFITQSMCQQIFIHQDSSNKNIIGFPEEFVTQEMCDLTFECSKEIEDIPHKFRTIEMYKSMVNEFIKELIISSEINNKSKILHQHFN